ncbi:MAG: hypothetical protein IKD47_04425 [Clostridia bacterium]|nr:hypothetical protein [Clostridia bacterium]
MKKFLALMLALTAVFCFAGCADGKCDDCKSEKDVKEYNMSNGKTAEYCPLCALEHLTDIRGEVED